VPRLVQPGVRLADGDRPGRRRHRALPDPVVDGLQPAQGGFRRRPDRPGGRRRQGPGGRPLGRHPARAALSAVTRRGRPPGARGAAGPAPLVRPPVRPPSVLRPPGVIMSFASIVMMIVAIVTVWGGLAAAVVNLTRHPEADD